MAQNCRFQEMRLLQLQGSGRDAAAIADARALLDACQNGGSVDLWGNDRGFFGDNRRREVREPAPREPQVTTPSGTLRTWCVRRCDGYYFPISFSTTRDRLEFDNVVCQTLCPAGQSELFYHYLNGQGPEQMQSLTGEAYTDLETAFSYRKVLDSSCTCGRPNSPLYDTPAVPRQSIVAVVPERTFVPRARPPAGEDPESALNRRGGLSLQGFEARPPLVTATGGSGVRVILQRRNPSDSSYLLLSPIPTELPKASVPN